MLTKATVDRCLTKARDEINDDGGKYHFGIYKQCPNEYNICYSCEKKTKPTFFCRTMEIYSCHFDSTKLLRQV